jgi:outer membrane protein OmpA-like peptidoglycan-associated protein
MGDTAGKSGGAGTMNAAQWAWVQSFLLGKSPADDEARVSPAAAGGSDRALAATDTDLFFDKDSPVLTKSDRDALDRYAKAYLAANSADPVTIDAWASKEGDDKHNSDLANARAKAVADYLAGQHIPKDRLKAAGRGPTDKFAKDDLAQNRRATLAPPPPAAPGKSESGDPHMPKDLHMRDQGDGRPVDDPLHRDDAVRHVVGEGSDVPRAQVERALKDWLTTLSGNQPNMKGKVRATDAVAEAERLLRKGLPGNPVMPRGNDKDYDPGALAKQIAENLPPTIPAENFAEFRKLAARDAPKARTTTEALHDKYKEERDELVKKLPKSVQDYAKKGLDAVVEKGVPYVLDKGLGAADVDSKLQGEVKDFADKWAKKITGNEDGGGDK